VRGEGREGAFGRVVDGSKIGAGLTRCGVFVGRELRVDINVKVRIFDGTHKGSGVGFGPSK
jgi:hypothetical protein